MAELEPTSPAAGLLPLAVNGADLTEVLPARITSVAPFRGTESALSDAMKAAWGVGFPAPGRTTSKGGVRAIWSGLDQALVLSDGAAPDLSGLAATTDQSDGWAVLRLEGPAAEAVLARLTPHDLNGAIFKRGHTARTLIQHVNVVLARVGPEAFEMMCLRSFARSLIHDLHVAMKSVAALVDLNNKAGLFYLKKFYLHLVLLQKMLE